MANPAPAESIALDPATLDRLRGASTATVATLLYMRGYLNAYIQSAMPLAPGKPTMVGPAFTLRYIPARPDTDPIEAFRERDHPQRVAVEECPEGAVLVMDCRGDASAASAGSILLTRLEMRGCAGVVTDGGVRDAEGAAALSMPVYAGKPSAPTNLTKHHAVDIGLPIACGEVAVYPGDILLGDGDGVMVIPRHLADEIAAEALPMEVFESFVLEQVRAGQPIIGLYPPTDAAVQERYKERQGSRSS
ncbi:ribonuclease activity regulator RraA [Vannielia litorea]|uniref:ribonuclease activity regulator RraA n=1 Tax=Vannielia litorea TaxID=1217970 RepID=UPI001C94A80F|nr:ribonuclease activity regulator RraA [Vannielia litorea]MBY6047876.1 ribonuclease activity regulator RraA [Vannielia litorea]MBY6075290.1 ribonuclease activity regulator RraA [Vannielia litorea]